jgi:hypothetical protein
MGGTRRPGRPLLPASLPPMLDGFRRSHRSDESTRANRTMARSLGTSRTSFADICAAGTSHVARPPALPAVPARLACAACAVLVQKSWSLPELRTPPDGGAGGALGRLHPAGGADSAIRAVLPLRAVTARSDQAGDAPPEQSRRARLDARTDQFSFCVALYEGLYGQIPFDRSDTERHVEAVLSGTLTPAPRGSPVPVSLHAHIVRGLAVAPEDRHPSMIALLAALDGARSSAQLAKRRAIAPWVWALARLAPSVVRSISSYCSTSTGALSAWSSVGPTWTRA